MPEGGVHIVFLTYNQARFTRGFLEFGPISRRLVLGVGAVEHVLDQLHNLLALDQHRVYARDTIGIADFSQPSSEPRFHLVDVASGAVESFRVAHGRGSDPDHSGFVEKFSNDFGSHATSNGTGMGGGVPASRREQAAGRAVMDGGLRGVNQAGGGRVTGRFTVPQRRN